MLDVSQQRSLARATCQWYSEAEAPLARHSYSTNSIFSRKNSTSSQGQARSSADRFGGGTGGPGARSRKENALSISFGSLRGANYFVSFDIGNYEQGNLSNSRSVLFVQIIVGFFMAGLYSIELYLLVTVLLLLSFIFFSFVIARLFMAQLFRPSLLLAIFAAALCGYDRSKR